MSLTRCYWNSNNNALPQEKNVLQIRAFLGKGITFLKVILKALRGSQYDLFACERLKLFPSILILWLHLASQPIVIDKRTSNSLKVNWLLFFEIYMRNCVLTVSHPTPPVMQEENMNRGKDSTNGWEGQRWNAKGSTKFHQNPFSVVVLCIFQTNCLCLERVCNFKKRFLL